MRSVIDPITAFTRGWCSWATVLAVAFGLVGVPASPAQDTADGQTVKAIEVRYLGSKAVDQSRILANMSTRVGDILTQEKLDDDTRSLFASGDVDNVFFDTEPAEGGVKLVVFVQARSILGEVTFDGNVAMSASKLRGKIELDPARGFTDADLQVARNDIETYYQKRGYADATVSYRIEDTPQGFSRVVFVIDEGGKSLLKDIGFEGNTVFSERELQRQIKTRPKDITRLFIGGGKIDYDVLEQDINRIRDTYGDAGYVDADVEVRSERYNDERVNLIFTISEGQKYDVAGVNLRGIQAYTSEELSPALVTFPGEPYSVTNIRTDQQSLRDWYGAKGYADVRIITDIDRAPGNQLTVNYEVEEGEISRVGRVTIRGNDISQDRVIRRELLLAPGEIFDLVKLDKSRRRLESLRYFSEIDMFPSDTGVPGQKDLVINVVEQDTGSVNFAAGFSSIEEIVGQVEVVQENFDILGWGNQFRGAGQRFRAGVSLGTVRSDASISLYNPWFNDRQLGLGGELYYRERLFLSDYYDETDYGGRVYLRKPIGENGGFLEPQYRLHEVKVDVDNDASDELKAEDGNFLESRVGLAWVLDRRDDIFLPRTGHRLRSEVYGSGGFLGGDVDIYGLDLEGSKYFSLPFDTILSFRGQMVSVDTWGDADTVPIFARTFLGGLYDLRGFDYREVGPKDENGEPLGGQSSIFGSVEYSFPIFADKVRGSVFFDVGSVSTDAWKFDGDVNSDVGIGLRLDIVKAIGPINLYFGVPVQSDEFNDSDGKFSFKMGYAF